MWNRWNEQGNRISFSYKELCYLKNNLNNDYKIIEDAFLRDTYKIDFIQKVISISKKENKS